MISYLPNNEYFLLLVMLGYLLLGCLKLHLIFVTPASTFSASLDSSNCFLVIVFPVAAIAFERENCS